MITSNVKAYSEKEQREIEWKLKITGYNKTADCMWAKVYSKGDMEIVLEREW